MDFLKKVVPPILSGDVVLDTRDGFQESSPRLLKMRCLSLLSSEKTVDEEDGINFCHSNYDKHHHHQLGKVKMFYFQSLKKYFRKVKLFLQVSILVSINLYFENQV